MTPSQTPRMGGLFGETPTPGQMMYNTPSRYGETPVKYGDASAAR